MKVILWLLFPPPAEMICCGCRFYGCLSVVASDSHWTVQWKVECLCDVQNKWAEWQNKYDSKNKHDLTMWQQSAVLCQCKRIIFKTFFELKSSFLCVSTPFLLLLLSFTHNHTHTHHPPRHMVCYAMGDAYLTLTSQRLFTAKLIMTQASAFDFILLVMWLHTNCCNYNLQSIRQSTRKLKDMKHARNDIKKKKLLQVKSHAEILSLLSLRGTAVWFFLALSGHSGQKNKK